ncbi:MAG: FtsX-like permease family protein [Lentisphaerae bacterium]|jgi:putative ABC transport system permease protein|nr:FtsX-like permease family protein [Lentisphaerota bacterium]MBT4820653.1 FtsX-like permease family protein [Lentisphaerota bacterium]MBT5611041.1 FtsX-like permease family protein [Lentisphaerota bacterium]MBT7053963.1 FtsX-like permease family protein [Lentisphaerota bacterium]MBT7841045.1 FtsX-like permease family protein [Lentisphaerota bacterium]
MRVMRWLLTPVHLIVQSLFLALGEIWANKVRALLTTVGIVIGVASVTAVIAALSGLKRNVLLDLETFGTNKIYVVSKRPKTGPHRYASWRLIRFQAKHFEDLLEHCPSVSNVTRIAGGGSGQVRHRDETADAQTRGIEPSWHDIEGRSVIMGRPFSLIDNDQTRQVCLITPKLRDTLKLNHDCIGERVIIHNRSFVVVGVVEPPAQLSIIDQGRQQDEVFIPFQTFEKVFGGWVYAMAVSRTTDVSDEALAELRFFLRRKRGLKPGQPDTFKVDPIQQYIEKFNRISGMVTVIAGAIVGISLLVGGVGIMNIMLVSVSERTREIGLRKAVGARDSVILLQFLVEAIVLCLIGGAAGVLTGHMLTRAMAQIPKAKLEHAHIPMWAIAVAFGFSALVGVTFGIFPAMKAARLDPIEALRHE